MKQNELCKIIPRLNILTEIIRGEFYLKKRNDYLFLYKQLLYSKEKSQHGGEKDA